ncbi:MAG: spore cortex biosynthesis protein YabQ [Oscillospiraceae bacterium]|nr:spore cortex biosynthesis protein YabQ [Oscillospiraceae bacterium]
MLGAVYDALAVLARKLRFAFIRVLFDILFWIAVLAALAWYAFAVGGGELRIYALAGVFLGGALYFTALSRASRRLLEAAFGAMFWLLRVCAAPAAACFTAINKFCGFLSNLFHFAEKRDILYRNADEIIAIRERVYKRGGGLEENQEAKAFHNYRNRNLLRIRRHKFDKSSDKHKRAARAGRYTEFGAENGTQRQRRFTSSYRI